MGGCISSSVISTAPNSASETENLESSKWNGEFAAIFENPVILKTILSHVSNVEDLKRARQVCPLWRDMSLETWRTTATLRLLWRRDQSYFCYSSSPPATQHLPPRQTLTREDFLQLLERSMREGLDCPFQLARIPFSRYRIRNCQILQLGSTECNKLGDFLTTLGPFMKYLHLDHCAILPTDYEEVLKWFLCEKLTSLAELSMTLIPGDGDRMSDDMLDVHRLQLPSVSRVTTMSFSLCKQWPLGREVDRFNREVNYREESLSGKFPSGIAFPLLNKLYLYRERAISFRALRTLTGLKLLWIESFNGTPDWNRRIAVEAEEFQVGGMETLWGKLEHLHVDYYRFNGNTLGIVEGWMPNLKKLDLVLTKSTWELVHQLWPSLEEVTNLRI